jgi:hypothetical protein
LTIKEIELVAKNFLKQYKGAVNAQVWVSESEEEAFGPGNDEGIVAAYYPDKDVIVIIANYALSVQDIIESLQNGIIVLKGLGVLSQEVIDTLLADVLKASESDPVLKGIMVKVKDLYFDKPPHVQAEGEKMGYLN